MRNVSASLTLLEEWLEHPYRLGHLLGFKKLTPQHNAWIHMFLRQEYGRVRILQAHRGAYKTTCGLVAMTLLVMLMPNVRVLIARKSQKMASKLIGAMQKIFDTQVVQMWMYSRWDVTDLKTDKWNTTELRLSINTRISPEPNFTAVGTATAQTGDHYDYIWSDDIITPEDRYSEKERDRTKNYIHELENIIDPTGIRMFSGTPWHEKDGFSMLEAMGYKIHRYPLGSILIAELTPEIIDQKMRTTPRSLWAANMLLRHERDANPEFPEPIYENCPRLNMPLYAFIDGAFGGENNCAIWIGGEHNGLIYLVEAIMYGNSIADHWSDIQSLWTSLRIRKFFYEDNGAQKLIGSRLTEMGIPNEGVTSSTNKYADITNTLKPLWPRLRFAENLKPPPDSFEEITEDTIPHPLSQVLEYNEDTEQDDSPDALAKLCRQIADRVGGFMGDFPRVERFSTEYLIAVISTNSTDSTMQDKTSVAIVGFVPRENQAAGLWRIEFTGKTWFKSIADRDVMRELLQFLDRYHPIEVVVESQDFDTGRIFVKQFQQIETELNLSPRNLWATMMKPKNRHEQIVFSLAGNKDRMFCLADVDQDFILPIVGYTKAVENDQDAVALSNAIVQWQSSANMQKYMTMKKRAEALLKSGGR